MSSRRSPSGISHAFGPGPITPAVRLIILINVGVWIVTLIFPQLLSILGLTPRAVVEQAYVWQFVTYLFLHAPDIMHILFNMLFVWMFGVDLERRWGTKAFTTYYFVTGIGAGVATILVSLLPFDTMRSMYEIPTVGASGAVYGLIMAWALVFPHRTILFMMIFPLPARTFALVLGAIAFFVSISGSGGVVNNIAHLGGLVVGWLYLKGPTNLRLELKYRLTKWRMERMRRRFGVHRGGRSDDWQNRVH